MKHKKNKQVSQPVRQLIGKKASQTPGSLKGVTGPNHPRFQGGGGRDFKKPSNQDYVWKNGVRKCCHYKCVLTGDPKNLVTHHLNGFNRFLGQWYDVKNGVLITKRIHKKFHDLYGYVDNAEAQWADFCKQYYNIDWIELRQKIDND